MRSKLFAAALIAGSLSLTATPLFADNHEFVVVNDEFGVPVFAEDITDRPYKIVGKSIMKSGNAGKRWGQMPSSM